MIVVFTVHHVYNTFLIFAKCEQETSNGSLTVYHQTFFPLLPWNFLPLRQGGKKKTVITCSCYGAIISVMFFEVFSHLLVIIVALIYKCIWLKKKKSWCKNKLTSVAYWWIHCVCSCVWLWKPPAFVFAVNISLNQEVWLLGGCSSWDKAMILPITFTCLKVHTKCLLFHVTEKTGKRYFSFISFARMYCARNMTPFQQYLKMPHTHFIVMQMNHYLRMKTEKTA